MNPNPALAAISPRGSSDRIANHVKRTVTRVKNGSSTRIMVIRRLSMLQKASLADYSRPARAAGVLMCPPRFFQIGQPENVHMWGKKGTAETEAAMQEWQVLVHLLESLAVKVHRLEPIEGLEDMVFTSNPSLSGVDREGRPFSILSRMRHTSRSEEVGFHAGWYQSQKIQLTIIPNEVSGSWEGGGDSLWHPGRYVLWAAHGTRSDPEVYSWLAGRLKLPIILLRLTDPNFYHLDTCLAMVDRETAVWVPGAFDSEGRNLIQAGFKRLIEVDPIEAKTRLACNLYSPDGVNVLLPSGAPKTRVRLEQSGLHVHEIQTDEFLKAGGSVYCMTQEIGSGR